MGQPGSNPLLELQRQGQSVWLDYIRRSALTDGEVQRLIDEDGLRGMTANPTIFQQAISVGTEYDASLERLARQGASSVAIYEALAVEDIQSACDLFRPVYDRTEGRDGFVSLEVAPSLAHNTDGTLAEARRLWGMVGRPNLMIKVPGTAAGAPAVEQLLYEGLNINITLLFSLQNYERVAWAYVSALERRVRDGLPVNRIASVASFFVSRVDTLVDGIIEKKLASGATGELRSTLEELLGKTAIANARIAYQQFEGIYGETRFAPLEAEGARVQRPLWASTSVKNPAYADLLYAEALIGPDTVDTMPRETLDAFRDHGRVSRTVDECMDAARETLHALSEAGISYEAVTKQLEDEGVDKFAQSFDALIAGIGEKCEALQAGTAVGGR